MKSAIIYQSLLFKLTSYGKGLSYCLEYLPDGTSIYVQGDNAHQLREEWEAMEDAFPDKHQDEILTILFSNNYSEEG